MHAAISFIGGACSCRRVRPIERRQPGGLHCSSPGCPAQALQASSLYSNLQGFQPQLNMNILAPLAARLGVT